MYNINSFEAPTITKSISLSKHNILTLDSFSTYNKIKLNEDEYIIFSNYEMIRKYENIIREKCITVELEKKYLYRPEFVSKKLYNTTDLWYLILFLNRIQSPMEFNQKYITVLDPNYINIINEIYMREKEKVNNRNNPILIENLTLKGTNTKSKQLIYKDFTIHDMIIPPSEDKKDDNEYHTLVNIIDIQKDYSFGLNSIIGYSDYKVIGNDYNTSIIDIHDNISVNSKNPRNFKFNSTIINNNDTDKYFTLAPIYYGSKVLIKLNNNIMEFPDIHELYYNQLISSKLGYNPLNKVNMHVIHSERISIVKGDMSSKLCYFKFSTPYDFITLKSKIKVKYEIFNEVKEYERDILLQNMNEDQTVELFDIIHIDDAYGQPEYIEYEIINTDKNNNNIISKHYNRVNHLFNGYNFKIPKSNKVKIDVEYHSNGITDFFDLLYTENFKKLEEIPSERLIFDHITDDITNMSIVNILDKRKEKKLDQYLCKDFNFNTSISLNKYDTDDIWLEVKNLKIFLRKNMYYRVSNEIDNSISIDVGDNIFVIDRTNKKYTGEDGYFMCKVYYYKKFKEPISYMRIQYSYDNESYYALPYSNYSLLPIIDNNLVLENEKNITGIGDYDGINIDNLILSNEEIDNFFISLDMSCHSYGMNGSMGVLFKIKESEKVGYLLAFKMKDETTNCHKSYLHGLYKVHYQYNYNESINCGSSNIDILYGEKLADIKDFYIDDYSKKKLTVYIKTSNTSIKIYNDIEKDPFIEYYDKDPILFEGSFKVALLTYNIRYPKFENISINKISYKEKHIRNENKYKNINLYDSVIIDYNNR